MLKQWKLVYCMSSWLSLANTDAADGMIKDQHSSNNISIYNSTKTKYRSLNAAGLPLRKPPRADGIMNYGYNVFLGETPEEQRSHMVGNNPRLFRYTGGTFTASKFRKYDQFSELSSSVYCETQSESSVATSINSAAMLRVQNSAALGQETHFSDNDILSNFVGRFEGLPDQIKTISGTTLFGNTANSIEASTNIEAGYSFAYNKYSLQKLYSAQNDFNKIYTWTFPFRRAVAELGVRPSEYEVLNFFASWGTHGIEKGAFGERCESTLYMTGGASMSTYASALSDIDIQAELEWFNQEGSISSLNEITGSFDSGAFNYIISNRVCRGKLRQIAPCAGLSQTFGFDEPDILQWTYMPLWDMKIPRLQRGARRRMKEVAEKIQSAGEECGVDFCNGNGACTSNPSSWKKFDESSEGIGDIDYIDFWDPTRCFCFDGYLGSRCDQGYMLMSYPFSYFFDGCPIGTEVPQFFCESAAKVLGGEGFLKVVENNMLGLPYGCSIDPDTKEIFYNKGSSGWAFSSTQPVCKKVSGM